MLVTHAALVFVNADHAVQHALLSECVNQQRLKNKITNKFKKYIFSMSVSVCLFLTHTHTPLIITLFLCESQIIFFV